MPLSLSERAEGLAEIDAQLAELSVTARHCRERRNSFAAISTLPPELLYQVFQWLIYSRCFSPRGRYMGNDGVLQNDLVPISQVCRFWRQTALESPTLWSCLFPQSNFLSSVMVSRSEKSSLYVHLNADHGEDIWKFGVREAHRVHTYVFDLEETSYSIEAYMVLLNGPPLCNLVEMRMWFGRLDYSIIQKIVHDIDSTQFPTLQRLKLEDSQVIMDPSKFPRLRSFECDCPRTLKDVLCFISQHLQLEDLTVDISHFYVSEDLSATTLPASNLRRFALMGPIPISICSELLTTLACTQTRLSLDIKIRIAVAEGYIRLFVDSVRKATEKYLRLSKTVAYARRRGTTEFLLAEQVSASRRLTEILEHVRLPDDIEFILHLTSRDRHELRGLCAEMLRGFPPSNIETLQITLDTKQLGFWLDYLPLLTSLKHLSLGGVTGNKLLEGVMLKQDEGIFPSLKEVYLRRLVVVNKKDISKRRPVSYEMIRDWVVKRAEQQIPLSLLWISSNELILELLGDIPVGELVVV